MFIRSYQYFYTSHHFFVMKAKIALTHYVYLGIWVLFLFNMFPLFTACINIHNLHIQSLTSINPCTLMQMFCQVAVSKAVRLCVLQPWWIYTAIPLPQRAFTLCQKVRNVFCFKTLTFKQNASSKHSLIYMQSNAFINNHHQFYHLIIFSCQFELKKVCKATLSREEVK